MNLPKRVGNFTLKRLEKETIFKVVYEYVGLTTLFEIRNLGNDEGYLIVKKKNGEKIYRTCDFFKNSEEEALKKRIVELLHKERIKDLV